MRPSASTTELEAMGHMIRDVEVDDGMSERHGTDANGVRVEGHVDPVTGDILSYPRHD